MTDWATSGRVKIERAKEHIGNLEAEIVTFLKPSPYSVFIEDDEQAGQVVWRLRVAAHPPLRWGAIAGDAIHNLRSALDYLWRRVWFPGGGGEGNRRIQFPICDSADAFEAAHQSVVKGPKKAAVDLLKAIKPYKGGNDLLWGLHVIDTIDKHRLLIPAYAYIGTTTLDFAAGMRQTFRGEDSPFRDRPWTFPPMRIGLKWADPLCPVTDGAEVFRCPIKDREHCMSMKPEFPLQIAFGEGEMIKGEPIVPTLHQMANVVEQLAAQFVKAGLLS